MSSTDFDFISIGGGAAGFFGALSAAESSSTPIKIAILEATPRLLTKVKISGGGRCNVTNGTTNPKQLVSNYPRGGKKLINGFFSFGPTQMLRWLSDNGVETHLERDGRIFPESNRSQSIIDCFLKLAESHKIEIFKGHRVEKIMPGEGGFEISTKKRTFTCRKLLLATGSMPFGHDLVKSLGHSITDLAPSLFTLKSDDPIVEGLAGISFADVDVSLKMNDKVFHQRGPVLITHWGFSGPAILKLSAFAAREFQEHGYRGELELNWLADSNSEKWLLKLREVKSSDQKKLVKNTKFSELPQRFWQRLIELDSCDLKSWQEVSDKDLRSLSMRICKARYFFEGKGEFKEEFVTCGGVDLKEVDLKTFESKLIQGLYFAGELLDVDGITGGFNFQHAWTSSRLAAQNAVMKICG